MSERAWSESRGSQREIWQREEKLARNPRESLGETALRLVSSRFASPRSLARVERTINRVRCTEKSGGVPSRISSKRARPTGGG